GPSPAVEAEDRSLSYEALDDLAWRFARFFQARGLVPGDRVSLLMANEAALVGAYFGAFRARLVANPINNRLTPEEVAYIIEHAGSRCVVVSAEHAGLIERTLPLLRERPLVLAWSDAGSAEMAELLAMPATAIEAPPPVAEDGALLIYTSGTTGKPKGVLLSQGNVMAGLEYVSRA